MIPQLEAATIRIEQANAALDELIFALNARLTACRKAHARKRERERQQQRAVDAPVPNLWWVGGVIPLNFVGGGGLGRTPDPFGGGSGYGTTPNPKKPGGGD